MSVIQMPTGGPEKPTHAFERTSRFMERVHQEIKSMPDAEARVWVRRQLRVWVRAYERWALDIDAGRVVESDAVADDYLDTISALGRLLRELGDD